MYQKIYAYSYWIDWAKLAQGEQNFIINALQLISFQYYAELLTWLGEPEDAKRWSVEADKMRQSLKRFWSEEKGLFDLASIIHIDSELLNFLIQNYTNNQQTLEKEQTSEPEEKPVKKKKVVKKTKKTKKTVKV